MKEQGRESQIYLVLGVSKTPERAPDACPSSLGSFQSEYLEAFEHKWVNPEKISIKGVPGICVLRAC